MSAHGWASICGERGTMATTSIQTEGTAETYRDQTEGCSTPQPSSKRRIALTYDFWLMLLLNAEDDHGDAPNDSTKTRILR